MTDYTPTTEEVRRDYAAMRNEHMYSPTLAKAKAFKETGGGEGEFDRWLAGEIRKAKTEARAEALAKARAHLDRIAPNGLISKAYVLADLDGWAARATRGMQPNGTPYTEES